MNSIRKKIKRIQNGASPRVLDIFSGCGGIALGFKLAGYEIVAGLDSDREAMATWWHNFHPELAQNNSLFAAADITKTHPERFFKALGMPGMQNDIDVLCGGPPCQAYSRIGLAKLRSLNGHNAHLDDPRGDLYEDYLRFVRRTRPLAILIENVPDSVSYGGENIPELISSRLSRSDYDYDVAWTVLDAVEYGVPQFRERVIILAIHRELGIRPSFPAPTHQSAWLGAKAEMPRGMRGRAAIELLRRFAKTGEGRYFIAPPPATAELMPAVSVGEALDDLPEIRTLTPSNPLPPGCSSVAQLLPYKLARPLNDFQRLMRNWPGFETNGWVSGNVVRNTPRDFPIFQRMKEGDQYLQAVEIAMGLFRAICVAEEGRLGRSLKRGEIARIKKASVPPYAMDKFESKWWMLTRDKPSHTVTAHLQYDTYSHIHYDTNQARAVSAREAARLQSFPDGFRVLGNRGDVFCHIGNAVPPLLAAGIARELLKSLMHAKTKTVRKVIKLKQPERKANGARYKALPAGAARRSRA